MPFILLVIPRICKKPSLEKTNGSKLLVVFIYKLEANYTRTRACVSVLNRACALQCVNLRCAKVMARGVNLKELLGKIPRLIVATSGLVAPRSKTFCVHVQCWDLFLTLNYLTSHKTNCYYRSKISRSMRYGAIKVWFLSSARYVLA